MNSTTAGRPFTTFSRTVTLIVIATGLLSGNEGLASQDSARSDSLLESARYLQRAEEELNCSTAEARKWVGVASDAVGQYRPQAQVERDTAAMLKVRINFLKNDIENRQKALKQAASDTEKLLNARRLNSAKRVIQDVTLKTPTCDARFREWELKINRGLSEADRLVKTGDERVQVNPRGAVDLYEAALAINIEQPDMTVRIASAREAARHGHPVLKKVVWITVATAAAGAAAYYGKQYYDKKQREAAAKTPAKPAVTVVSPR